MTYIWDTYGTIDDADQALNIQRMKQQWMPPTPIETLLQLDDENLFAAKGCEVIDNSHIMRWAYDNVKNINSVLSTPGA